MVLLIQHPPGIRQAQRHRKRPRTAHATGTTRQDVALAWACSRSALSSRTSPAAAASATLVPVATAAMPRLLLPAVLLLLLLLEVSRGAAPGQVRQRLQKRTDGRRGRVLLACEFGLKLGSGLGPGPGLGLGIRKRFGSAEGTDAGLQV
jgi:hypothetical protein